MIIRFILGKATLHSLVVSSVDFYDVVNIKYLTYVCTYISSIRLVLYNDGYFCKSVGLVVCFVSGI